MSRERRGIPVMDIDGRITYKPDTSRMLAPVRHVACGGVFDEADVKQRLARYADCDVYICPRCKRQMDNRPYGGAFGSVNGVERLGRDGQPR